MAAESSCCRRISGGRGPSGDKSPTSGDETTGSSAHRETDKFWTRSRLKKKKKILVATSGTPAPMVEILKSYVAYFSSYCIHKIFLNLICALDLKVKSNSTFSLQR